MKPREKVLLELLLECLENGHWKVAIRRYFMLLALSHELPAEIAARCDALVAKYPRKELERIAEPVLAWVRMVARTCEAQPVLLHRPAVPMALGLHPPSVIRDTPAPTRSLARRKAAPPPRATMQAVATAPSQGAAVPRRSAQIPRQPRHRMIPFLQSNRGRMRVHEFVNLHAAFHGIRAVSSREVQAVLRFRRYGGTRVLKLNMQESDEHPCGAGSAKAAEAPRSARLARTEERMRGFDMEGSREE